MLKTQSDLSESIYEMLITLRQGIKCFANELALYDQLDYWCSEEDLQQYVEQYQEFQLKEEKLRRKYERLNDNYSDVSSNINTLRKDLENCLAQCQTARIGLYGFLLPMLNNMQAQTKNDSALWRYVDMLTESLTKNIVTIMPALLKQHEIVLEKQLNAVLIFINGFQQGLNAAGELSLDTLANLGVVEAVSKVSQALRHLFTLNLKVAQKTTVTPPLGPFTRRTTSPLSIALWLMDTSFKTLASYWPFQPEQEGTQINAPLEFQCTLLESKWYKDLTNRPLFKELQLYCDDTQIEKLLCDLIGWLLIGEEYLELKSSQDFNELLKDEPEEVIEQITTKVLNILAYANGFYCGFRAIPMNTTLQAKELQHKSYAYETANLASLRSGRVEMAQRLPDAPHADLSFIFSISLNPESAIKALEKKCQLSEIQYQLYREEARELLGVLKHPQYQWVNVERAIQLKQDIYFKEYYNGTFFQLLQKLEGEFFLEIVYKENENNTFSEAAEKALSQNEKVLILSYVPSPNSGGNEEDCKANAILFNGLCEDKTENPSNLEKTLSYDAKNRLCELKCYVNKEAEPEIIQIPDLLEELLGKKTIKDIKQDYWQIIQIKIILYQANILENNRNQPTSWVFDELAFKIYCLLGEKENQLFANFQTTLKDCQIIHELWLEIKGGKTSAQELFDGLKEKQEHLNEIMQHLKSILDNKIQMHQRVFYPILSTFIKLPGYQQGTFLAEAITKKMHSLLIQQPSTLIVFNPLSMVQKKYFKSGAGAFGLVASLGAPFFLPYLFRNLYPASYGLPVLNLLSQIINIPMEYLLTTKVPTFFNRKTILRSSQLMLFGILLYINTLFQNDTIMPVMMSVLFAELCNNMFKALKNEKILGNSEAASLLNDFLQGVGYFAISAFMTPVIRNIMQENDKISTALHTLDLTRQQFTNGISKKELKIARNLMLFKVHPDKARVGNVQVTQAVIQDYDILSQYWR